MKTTGLQRAAEVLAGADLDTVRTLDEPRLASDLGVSTDAVAAAKAARRRELLRGGLERIAQVHEELKSVRADSLEPPRITQGGRMDIRLIR